MTRRCLRVIILVAVFSGTFGLVSQLAPQKASATINTQINFQGKLTNPDGTNVTSGSYSIRFRIYNDPSLDGANACAANSCKWEETQASVSVTDGIFGVALGSSTALPGSVDFNSSALYLGIKVGADLEMTPRIQLTASPYAFNSSALNGLASSNFVQLAQGLQTDASTTAASIAINKTGTTAKLIQLQRAGTDIFDVNNDGSALHQTTTNSTTAFRIQDSSTNAVLNADTTNGDITLGVGNLKVNGTTLTAAPTIAGFTTAGTLTNATTYFYIVSAVGPGGEGYGYSTTPNSYLTTNATSRVQVTWTAAAGATSYKVYRSTDNLNWKVQNVGNVLTYNDSSNGPWSVTGFPPDFSATGNIYLQTGGGLQFNPSATVFAQYSVFNNALELSNTQSGSGISLSADNIKLYDTTGTNANVAISNIGAVTLKNRTNSASAFQIMQNSTNDVLFSADTTNNRIKLGNSTGTDTATTILVLDSAISDPTTNVANGAMYYDSVNNKFRCYQASAWTNCIGAGGGDLQAAYAASSSPATITTSATAKGVILKAGATFDSSSLFQIQNAASLTVLNVDSTGNSAVNLLTNNTGTPTWISNLAAPETTARKYIRSIAYNGKIYNWGGTPTGFAAGLNTMDIFDTTTNTWSAGVTGGTARSNYGAIIYNGKIYYWGGMNTGSTPLNTLDIYDIAAGTWSTGTAGGTARSGISSVVNNGKIYYWGGTNSGGTIINTLDIYDIAAGTWSTGTAGGTARTAYSATLNSGMIYYYSGQTLVTITTILDIYDIANDSWSVGASGPLARNTSSAVNFNGKMYVWGGSTNFGTAAVPNYTDIYNYANNSWTTAATGTQNRSFHGAVVINSRMYITGGLDGYGYTLGSIDILNLTSLVWNGDNLRQGGVGRAGHAFVPYNGKQYNWGGLNLSGSASNTMDVYDFVSNTWSVGTAGGTARSDSVGVAYNGKMYIWGGNSTVMDIYNFSTNSWSTGLSGGSARTNTAGVLYNGKIYYWGGTVGGTRTNTLDIYNIDANTWSTGTAGGTARANHTTVLFNGKIYGWGGLDTGGAVLNTMDIYNIATNSWSTGATGGTARRQHGSILYNNKIYSFGGETAGAVGVLSSDAYDPVANSWSTITSLTNTRYIFGLEVFNNKIYLWGGFAGAFRSNALDILDMGGKQAGLLVLGNGTVDPTGQDGGIYYNTDSNNLRCYSFTTGWQNCNSASNWQIGSDSSHYVQSGNVGIGTASPTSLLQVTGNSTSAFSIQSSADTIVKADTTNNRFMVGNSTGTDTATTILVLDSAISDPTTNVANGAMYYDNVNNKFRCYQASAWTNCVGAGGGSSLQAAYTASTGGTTPEIKLDATRAGLDIQDADSTINSTLFAVRASNGAGLGAGLLTVDSTGKTIYKNSANSTSAFQIQNSSGSVQLGIDTTNGLSIFGGIAVLASTSGVTSSASNSSNTIEGTFSWFTDPPAIAKGSDGLPIEAHWSASSTTLRVGKCLNLACSSTTLTTVDSSSGNVGDNTAMAIGTDGLPFIAYRDQTNGDLRVTKCGNLACSAGNTQTSIDLTTAGFDNSVAIGTDGLPVIAYKNAASDVRVIKCGNAACSSGNTTTTIEAAISNDRTSIAVAPDGLPILSYDLSSTKDLRVVKCGNAACSSGNTLTTIDTVGNVGTAGSLTIGSDGLPIISYSDATTPGLKVAKCSLATCASGNTFTVVDNASIVSTTSITVASDGLPIIAYDSAGTIFYKVAKCNDLACSTATKTTVGGSSTGQGNQIIIGNDGLPVGVTVDGSSNLIVIRCGKPDCTSGSSNINSGGVGIGASGNAFQYAYINSIRASDPATPFTIQYNNVNRITIDTSGNLTLNAKVVIGSATSDTVQQLIQLDSYFSFADTATCATTTNQGATYYNTLTNSVRGCVDGGWQDMVPSGLLGLQLFGIVPDSGTAGNNGDIAGVTALTAGPCKVSEGGTTGTISWTGCTAYSGGRKVIVAAGTRLTSAGTSPTIIWQHLCLSAANNTPSLSIIGLETDTLGSSSMPSTTTPVLCLADIRVTNGSSVITGIYNTATYTTTVKEFATAITTAPVLGQLVKTGTVTPGSVTATTVAAETKVVGVVVATTGVTSTNTVNAIVAIGGPAWVKAITGTNAVGDFIQPTATAGYANTAAFTSVNGYLILGMARTAWTTACAINSLACNNSILTNVAPR